MGEILLWLYAEGDLSNNEAFWRGGEGEYIMAASGFLCSTRGMQNPINDLLLLFTDGIL